MQIKSTKKHTENNIIDTHTSTLPHYHTKKCVEQHYCIKNEIQFTLKLRANNIYLIIETYRKTER